MAVLRLTQVISITLACCVVSLAQPSLGAKLRGRVLRYHSYFVAGKAEKMWEMSSRKLRRENDGDRAGFIRQMPIAPPGHAKTNLVSLKINGQEAMARVEFQILPVGSDKWVSEVYDETWVFERGNWFFDSYRLAEGSYEPQGGS
jgi:hypothetical protein